MNDYVKTQSCQPIGIDKTEAGTFIIHFSMANPETGERIGWRSEQPDVEWAQKAYDEAVFIVAQCGKVGGGEQDTIQGKKVL